ncbi:Aminopeptidase N [Camponotus floridanus]|uniref:Aminopeptidase n=1 Tax=Camponotus floridanus TaxID=104421 RepID=E2AWQ8_CAMFO|nr:Aminopeptidase N [Camponotus floridanus]
MFPAFRTQLPLVTRRQCSSVHQILWEHSTCSPIRMEDHQTQGRSRHGWHVRARVAIMIFICVAVSSMIIYWFVSSIIENRRNSKYRGSIDGKSHKMAYLERLSDQVLPLEYTWIAVSNFSPNYARTAYPCFDEPWIKTPFHISIARKSNMRSHSNSMRNVTEEIRDMPGYVWDHYEKTLPMSTYLVAFMVTDFVSYEIAVTDRPSHTIFLRKDVANNIKYIGNLIPKLLRLIQNFTEFYYELDKLDAIVVPSFAYSAMENWGLITFREDSILIQEADGIANVKKEFASIAAHEVAHQWFGNLVTPKWWDDVWLKEGFASFFGYLALSVLEPASWDLQTSFLIECRDMFDSDADETAHPLHIDLSELSSLADVFDLTSYVKGNCMAHMIYHFLGERIFLSAVRRYIRTYRSANQTDLWSAFQGEIDEANGLLASSGLRMKDIMRTWTYQAGFPVLHVRQNRETGVIEFTQNRFYHYGLNSTSKELWHIPLTWTTENEQQFGNTLPKAWMVKKHMKINDTALSQATFNNHWILFNINQTALYRVNYDIKNWKLLTKSFRALPKVAKVQVLTDSSAMVNAGLLNKRIMWSILEKLETESEEMLWTPAMPLLTTIQSRLWDSSIFEVISEIINVALNLVMCKFIDKVYSKMEPSLVHKDPLLWTEFEVNVMKSACLVGHRACLRTALNFTDKMLQSESSNSVPEKFRSWMYCTFMKVATDKQWLEFLKRYNESAVYEKESLAFALGCHVNPNLLKKYLPMIFSQKNTPKLALENALTSVVLNPYGYHVAMEFLIEHWDKFNANAIEKHNNYANVVLINIFHVFAKRIHQEEDVEWLRRLKGMSKKYDTVIGRVINRARINVAWYEKEKNETLKILKEISMRHAETKYCRKQN